MPAGPMRLALAADHGGFALKQELASWLRGLGHAVEDLGVHSPEPADYPDTALALARRVASHGADLGIVLDAAGNGSAIAANKVPGIRAAVGYTVAGARSSREHNDANVLALAAAGLTVYEARAIVAAWLESRFAGGRHQRRVDKIVAGEAQPQTPAPGVTALPRDQYTALVDRISSLIEPPPAPAPPLDASAAGLVELGACRLSACPPAPQLEAGLAGFIDHTLLKPEATRDEILELCREAREYGFASVCVNPAWTALAATELRASPVLVCTVVGFPLGAGLTTVKRFEAGECLKLGADELDMVLNVGALKSGLDDLVREDIRALAAVCHDACARLKVILETALLTDAEKVRACQLAQAAGADFVKTSTGFSSGGATAADVALMRATVGDCMGVKASGGVRDREAALAMIAAGATRLGASASVRIVTTAAGASSGY